jgi:ribosomal protein S21
MLIVEIKRGDIEKALKDLKSKVIKTRQNSLLNNRKEFKKKSVVNRQILNKAKYLQKKYGKN